MASPFKWRWLPKRGRKAQSNVQRDPVAALKTLRERFDHEPENRLRPFEKLNPVERLHSAVESLQQIDQSLQDERVGEALKRIAVVAFVGPSGTGKSTRAIQVASEHHIHYFIDDGLLIHGSRIVAGTSAKRARTKIESVRQALFMDQTRAANMRRALYEHQPTTLMILGTSDSMLQKICASLWLNPPSMLIRIEDVSTEQERRLAKTIRVTEGQHTIPVPSMEIKHEFSGYFADPLAKLRRRFDRERGIDSPVNDVERTVVRPTFSGLGTYSMSDEAIVHMIGFIIERIPGVAGMKSCRLSKEVYGVALDLQLSLYFGFNAQDVLGRVQARLSKQVEDYTSINVLAVNVRAVRLVKNPQAEGQALEAARLRASEA